jgi:hypothetical protein
VTLHRRSEPDDRLTRHQTIGIEDDHLVVRTGETPNPFGDVARFALRVLAPSPVKDEVVSARALPQREETSLSRSLPGWRPA